MRGYRSRGIKALTAINITRAQVAWLAGADVLNGLVNQEIKILVELTRIIVIGRD